jgi:hypothetical protein
MGMPSDIGAVDTMLGFPHPDMKEVYRFITRQTKDTESKEEFDFPVEYMFKDVPEKALEGSDDPIGVTLREMDLWGIDKGLIGVGDPSGIGAEALKRHPDRFIASSSADPNDGMEGVRRLVREHETYGTRAVGVFPSGTFPQVPINDKKMYPIYAKCVELGIPIFCCAGIPGPRLLFHQRLRPQVLPAGHRELRQHPGSRQDHLCRLLPDGPLDRTDHDRDAQRRIQRRRLAQIPSHQRPPGTGSRLIVRSYRPTESPIEPTGLRGTL